MIKELYNFKKGCHTFDLPTIIPGTASSVLVYVAVDTGKASHNTRQHLRIYTQTSEKRFEKYIYQYSYPQDAIVTNSENMWFPKTPDHKIYLEVTYDATPNCAFRMYALGHADD